MITRRHAPSGRLRLNPLPSHFSVVLRRYLYVQAIVSFKLANLPDVVKEMRKEGWIIEQKLVPYAAAMRRRKPKLT